MYLRSGTLFHEWALIANVIPEWIVGSNFARMLWLYAWEVSERLCESKWPKKKEKQHTSKTQRKNIGLSGLKYVRCWVMLWRIHNYNFFLRWCLSCLTGADFYTCILGSRLALTFFFLTWEEVAWGWKPFKDYLINWWRLEIRSSKTKFGISVIEQARVKMC